MAVKKNKKTSLSILDLKPDPNNPRTITPEAIKALGISLEEFGDLSGITWNKRTGELVAGHQRLEALKKEHGAKLKVQAGKIRTPGGEKFTIRVVDWSRDRQRIANVVANSHLIAGQFTENAIGAIDQIEHAYPELSGELMMGELADWIEGQVGGDEEPQDGLTDPDDVPEPPEEPTTKPGDLWILGDHRLLCGDATKAEDVERVMAGEKATLMVTDPPYGVDYDANWRNEADRASGKPDGARAIGKVTNDDRADWTDAWQLFTGDVLYVWHPPGSLQGVFLSSLQAAGFDIRMTIIWAKNQFPIGRGHYHVKHEPCFYGVRKGESAGWVGDRSQTTLWEIDKPHKSETGHSTQKPVKCMQRPIRNHKGDVYDPFCGSGTTIIAAEQLSRKCYAIEIEPRYVDVAVRRWEEFTGKKAKRAK